MQGDHRIKNGKKAKTAGFIFLALALFLFILLMSLTKNGKLSVSSPAIDLALVCMMLFLPLSVALLIFGSIRGSRAKRYLSFLPFLKGEHDIENIATMAGLTYRRVERDLAVLIRRGLLPGLQLDPQARRLVPADSRRPNESLYRKTDPLPLGGNAFIPVLCPNCGAENSIQPGRTSECEYCGAHLTVNQ